MLIINAQDISAENIQGPTLSTTAALIRETRGNQHGDLDAVLTNNNDLLPTQATFIHDELNHNRRGPITILENTTVEYESG